MKNIGIWLDLDKAYIITIENDVESVSKINSNVEHYRIHGGSGTRIKGGPQDVVQDSKYLEREKHQLRNYFNTIISSLDNVEQLALYGPAETRIKLEKVLKENHKSLYEKVVHSERADSMTENQIKALARNFFKNLTK